MRKEGFYRVEYRGRWIIAQWARVASPHFDYAWLIPGEQTPRANSEFTNFDEDAISAVPPDSEPELPLNGNYEENVQRIATEMAKKNHPGTWEAAKTSLYERYELSARIAVSYMAEEIIIYVFGSVESYNSIEPNGGYLTSHLIQRGLIPAQEGGSDNV